ncbi:MAG TPA: hypothetical protein VF194_14010 [Ferrovibrio sp.]|uniref:hypothetical protein n=1 Tax=Ferrovibrio sp. TaxID=1917215 RepID=UPI002ED594DF
MPEPIEMRVRTLAVHSVGRGCFFAGLAIWCVMIGLIADPLQAIKSGAILTLIVACVLLLKATWVTHRSYRRTEVWLLLNRQIELRPEAAQRIITGTLREIYLRCALYAVLIAAGFCCFALIFWLAPGAWVTEGAHQRIGFSTGQHRNIEAFRTMP